MNLHCLLLSFVALAPTAFAQYYIRNENYDAAANAHKSPTDFLVFNLDDTLYSRHDGFLADYMRVIPDYIQHRLGISAEEAYDKVENYYQTFGITVKGLLLKKEIDSIHDYETYLDTHSNYNLIKPIPGLRDLLQRSTARLVILTNAGELHSKRAIKVLGLEDLFEYLFFVDYNKPEDLISKPDARSFNRLKQTVADLNGLPADSLNFYFVDDSNKNVKGARAVGWSALWLKEPAQHDSHVPDVGNHDDPHIITSVLQIDEQWPHLFRKN